MLVMILETVPSRLRGDLTRWLIEPHPGVFVGHVSGMVRERLWLKCCQGLKDGGLIQLWSVNNEQRFAMRSAGDTRRQIVDFEGLQLVRLGADQDKELTLSTEKKCLRAIRRKAHLQNSY